MARISAALSNPTMFTPKAIHFRLFFTQHAQKTELSPISALAVPTVPPERIVDN
jgi:hypothetical protein